MTPEIVLTRPGHFEFREAASLRDGRLQDDEVRVRVRRVGVCGTDIHAFHGRQPFFTYPRVLGHELGVEVLETANPDPRLRPGTLCTVEPYLNNPQSRASRRGKTNCCENLQVLGVHVDGGMRPELILPAGKLHPSATLSIDQLALVETLCIGAHANERARPQADDFCAVLGAGPIGLGCAAFARDLAGMVAVVDIQESRLAFCRDELGIPDTLLIAGNGDDRLDDRLRMLSGGDLPSLIIDATGNPQSMGACFDLAANGARIVFAGLFQGEFSIHDPTFHRKELAVLATRNATATTFQRVLDTVDSGAIRPQNWIGARLPFADVPSRFASTVATTGLVKAIIDLP